MTDLSFWKEKRVFVTGHTGFKGSWLCKILETLGADVTGYALSPQAEPNLFDICNPDVRSVIGDIRDFEKLSSIFNELQPEIVIHMAAQPLVLTSYGAPRYTYDVNVMGTVNLLECVRQNEGVISVLNVTTDKVYLNRERDEGYREDESLNGYDPYSNSKSCSELVTSSYKNSFFDDVGIAVSTARSGNVIGGGDFADNRIIPDCARAAANGESIMIRNARAVRPYLYVCDTLFAYLLILEKQYGNAALTGSYNIGPGESDCITNGELAALFCDAWDDGARWTDMSAESASALHEANMLKLDCAKIKRTLNWVPQWNIERAIKETAIWYKAFFEGEDVNKVMTRQIRDYLEAQG